MIGRSASRSVLTGALMMVASGGLLVGLAGAASASPVPSIPLTTAQLCTSGGGQVTGPAGAQRCSGGGDTGDFIISEDQAKVLQQTVPRPPVQTPPLPG